MRQHLAEIARTLELCLRELRQQYELAVRIEDPALRRAKLMLLSHSLRVFCRLQSQQRKLATRFYF